MDERAYDVMIARVARRHSLDPRLVKAIVHTESSYDPDAFRNEPRIKDASRGLMQILGRTAHDVGFEGPLDNLFDPETNLEIGSRYLARQLKRYKGDTHSAVAAYNAGAARRHSNQTFRNQPYVDKVMQAMQAFETFADGEDD